MKVAWIKISGWPDSYSERMDELAHAVDKLLVIRAKRLNGIEGNHQWVLKEFRPGRRAYLKPRIKVLLYPLWVILGALILAWNIWGDDYDVIHAADYPFDALAGGIAKLITGTPLVVSVRGLQLPRYEDDRDRITDLKNRLSRGILYSLNKISLSFADGIVTKAEYQQTYLLDTYGTDVPMISIPTGVDFKRFDPEIIEENGIIDDLVENNHKYTFVHLGKLVPGKGVDRLIENIGTVTDESVGFLLIGDFQNGNFRTRIRKRIGELGISDRVTIFEGKIPYDEVPELLQEADGVCLLSRSGVEGIPRVLQESVAMETPIIASDVDGIKGIFSHKQGCYLIDPNTTTGFSEAIVQAKSGMTPDRMVFQDDISMRKNYSTYKLFYKDI